MDLCYGCSACASACPTDAITMTPNAEGFLEPSIDADFCTECGMCKCHCPAVALSFKANGCEKAFGTGGAAANSNGETSGASNVAANEREDAFGDETSIESPDPSSPKAIYAFAVKNADTLTKSSSGGAFSVLAKWMYAKGGYVAGAAYDERFVVRHVLTTLPKELDLLLMSKYVQSDPGTCYRETKQALDAGIPVLYCGCPCQIAGLKSYLGKSYPNLITVDLLCHGVPSPKHLHDYLDENWGIENIADLSMRRSKGWGTRFYVKLKDGTTYEGISKNDLYLNAFLRDIDLRPTCYSCKFAAIPRVADITLGDCWSAKALKLGKPYEQRSSLVLANTEQGQTAWQGALAACKGGYDQVSIASDRVHDLTANKNVFEPIAVRVNPTECIKGDSPQLCTSGKEAVGSSPHASCITGASPLLCTEPSRAEGDSPLLCTEPSRAEGDSPHPCTEASALPDKRTQFARNSATMPFTQAARETLFPYDVGLLLYASDNYGSAATNFALYKAIESLGYRPVVLDSLLPIDGVSRALLQEHCAMSSAIVPKGKHGMINSLLDTFVVGSDQSLRWSFGRVRNNIEFFLMGFTDDSKRRIGYAMSSGFNHRSLPEDVRVLYEAQLKRFQALSVREDFAVEMCERLFHVKPDHVLDPVFLPNKQVYLDLAAEADLALPPKYVLAYIRYASPEKRDFVLRAAERLNAQLIVICDALYYKDLKQQLGLDAIIAKPTSPEWMAYYANATAVFTDSFHGTCFSLIFEKPFVAVRAGSKDRFVSLARIICDTPKQANTAFLAEDAQLASLDGAFPPHDYEMINRNLAAAREQSLNWLRDALSCDVTKHAQLNANELLVSHARTLRRKIDLEEAAEKPAPEPADQSGIMKAAEKVDRAAGKAHRDYKRARRLAGRVLRKAQKIARRIKR